MNWKILSIIAIVLAVVMALGFGYEQPLVGLISLLLLLAVGVYMLYLASLDEPKRKKKKKR